MNFYRRFPYTNLNDINLDWIIKKVKALIGVVDEKQDKPATTGTAGQVLGLDENLNPVWLDQTGGGGGTTNYNNLENKPQIEGVTLSGNKTAADLGLARASDVPTKTSDLTNDSGFVNASEAAAAAPVQSVNGLSGGDVVVAIPSASSALPQMDGVASAGSNFSQFARADHVHPTDISRVAVESLAPVENSLTATRAYAAGDYIVYQGQFYKATTAISAGQTLTPGSNIIAVSISSEVMTSGTWSPVIPRLNISRIVSAVWYKSWKEVTVKCALEIGSVITEGSVYLDYQSLPFINDVLVEVGAVSGTYSYYKTNPQGGTFDGGGVCVSTQSNNNVWLRTGYQSSLQTSDAENSQLALTLKYFVK